MTAIFPTAYSTLSAPALAAYVADRYGLPDTRCQFLVRGVGDTYRLDTAAGRFILRIYRPSHRNLSQITAEVELLLAAKEGGVTVSYPLSDKSGQYIQAFPAAEGLRHGVLFTYAPGETISQLSEPQLQNLGRTVARFHDVSSSVRLSDPRWTFDPETTLNAPLERARPYFATLPSEYGWWREAAAATIAHINQVDTSGFSRGYIHYDLLPQNFHFDGDQPTLFDFDFFGYGWLVYDLMTLYVHLSLDAHWGRLSPEAADKAWQTFLDAYCAQRPLSAAEISLIPWLSLSFWCFYMGFHGTHDQFQSFVQPSQLKSRTAVIRKLTEGYWKK